MRIHMYLHEDAGIWNENRAWFMSKPVEGPAYIATSRCTEAVRMVAFENHVWSSETGTGMRRYKSMPPKGGFE